MPCFNSGGRSTDALLRYCLLTSHLFVFFFAVFVVVSFFLVGGRAESNKLIEHI